ncbi:uncharacterized protein LOC119267375 isoform X1 [Triticum dicoccoides]|uniref:uncharacterized protein LOC119267375 isoform X1 n=1 Tax=Triticum dicoccoides TaxID=85692 RepID=UPI00188F6A8F|nr:uncharacterized protein LOC119267375 isoform X1 [Triticum dicoccoides]
MGKGLGFSMQEIGRGKPGRHRFLCSFVPERAAASDIRSSPTFAWAESFPECPNRSSDPPLSQRGPTAQSVSADRWMGCGVLGAVARQLLIHVHTSLRRHRRFPLSLLALSHLPGDILRLARLSRGRGADGRGGCSLCCGGRGGLDGIYDGGSGPMVRMGSKGARGSGAGKAIGFVALASVVARRGGAAAAAAATVRGMSFGGASSVAAGGKRPFEYGRTHVVRPKGAHKATIVWLHGLGDNGASWSQLLETLPLPNIKWICPTAPTRPVAIFGGFPSTAWFDVADLSEDSPDDVEGLDSSAAHVANLLSTEPADIKLGVGGFSMGAATALYSGTCFAHGKYGNGNPYPVNLSVAVGLSGWLPCARSLKNKIESSQEAAQKASSLPLMLCHGKADDVVLYKHGERSADALKSTGFANVEFKSYSRLGHYTVPEEMDEVVKWLTASLELGSSSST